MRRRVLALLAAVATAVAACSSGSGGQPPSSPGTGGSTSTGATTSAGTAASTPADSGATSAAPLPSLCPDATSTTAVTHCLSDSISTFWSGQLDATITEPVVLDPVPDRIPAPCRAGLTAAPAFTCPGNATLYFTKAFVTTLESLGTGGSRSYAFAVVLAHEMGHVVQLHVHQPQIDQQHRTIAVTRFVEQQADCLSGVWAHAATVTLGLEPAGFRATAERVLTAISTDDEIETHGTVAQRLAAIDRGLEGGRPHSCELATFH